jgi:hypothetical protein
VRCEKESLHEPTEEKVKVPLYIKNLSNLFHQTPKNLPDTSKFTSLPTQGYSHAIFRKVTLEISAKKLPTSRRPLSRYIFEEITNESSQFTHSSSLKTEPSSHPPSATNHTIFTRHISTKRYIGDVRSPIRQLRLSTPHP